jgi:MSHA biogenesis protein MshP
VTALFLIVVLASAGAFLLNVSGVGHRTSVLGLMGARAYQSALAGVEWAVHEVDDDPTTCASGTFSLTEGGLNGFSVTVTCATATHTENGSDTERFRITSQAEYGTYGDADYVSRTVDTTVAVPN